MRQLYFFFLLINVNFFAYSQILDVLQLELVNEFIGAPIDDCMGCQISTTNDNGLNQIFANHNVLDYEYIYPNAYLGENGESLFYLVFCSGCDINLLASDLNSYDSVIQYAAQETVEGKSVNVLKVVLIDPNIGVFTSFDDNDLVVTNDAGLTQIFQDFNVRKYILHPEPDMIQYSLVCDCDAQLLKNELNNYSSVIAWSSDVIYFGLLSLEEENKTKANIFPNPFKYKISVEINKPLESIKLYDILGKSIYKSSSLSDFENFSSTLNSGVYLLKLLTEDGESLTKKLIKS